jgi:hypothetical protein
MRSRLCTLRIGATEFKWTARTCVVADPGGDYHPCVRVRVRGSGKNGCALLADLASVSQGPRAGVPDPSYPAPGAVRAIIGYALQRGWDPAAAGGQYELRAGAGPEIPGFHVTGPVVGWRPEDGPRTRRNPCQG